MQLPYWDGDQAAWAWPLLHVSATSLWWLPQRQVSFCIVYIYFFFKMILNQRSYLHPKSFGSELHGSLRKDAILLFLQLKVLSFVKICKLKKKESKLQLHISPLYIYKTIQYFRQIYMYQHRKSKITLLFKLFLKYM